MIAKAYRTPNGAPVFNNAAQVWNHDFFWRSMKPIGVAARSPCWPAWSITTSVRHDDFEQAFIKRAMDHFGSGYVWLITKGDELRIATTENAVNPMVLGAHALLTCDLWEHAHYLDHQNDRETYVRGFLAKLANWQFAHDRFVDRKRPLLTPKQREEHPTTHH